MNIVDKIHLVNVAEDKTFQMEFSNYYKIIRKKEWKKIYYELFEKYKNSKSVSFSEILVELFKRTGQVEPSFASKMLAAINYNMPIWDGKILAVLGIAPSKKKGEDKAVETIALYDRIVNWYENINTKSEDNYIKVFNRCLPQFKNINDVQKISFLLLSLERESENTIKNNKNRDVDFQQSTKNYTTELLLQKKIPNINNKFADGISEHLIRMQQILKSTAELYKSISPIIERHNQIIESTRPRFERLSKILSNIQLKMLTEELPKSLIKSLGNVRYIQVLKRIKWPLFLEEDDEIKDIILSLYNIDDESYPLDELATEICKQYTPEKLALMTKKWEFMCSNNNRLTILMEAVKLHTQGFYYGSTAIMMSQVSGIIYETWELVEMNEIVVDEEAEKLLCDNFNVDYEKHVRAIEKKYPSERHLMLRLIMCHESGMLYFNALAEYIYEIIFTSKSEKYEEHNPLRNKICHGDELNFGTKEKSLKSIIVIDLLLTLKSELEWMIGEK